MPTSVHSIADGENDPETTSGVIGIVLAVHHPNAVFLRKQFESIVNQTDRSWRLMIVPDGPDHQLPDDLGREILEDDRVTILPAQNHGGSCRAFELGLVAMPEDISLLALCDQDDIWHPKKLEILKSVLHLNPRATMAFCDSEVIDEDDRVISDSLRSCEARTTDLKLHSIIARNTVSGHAVLFRRELLETALPFPPGVCTANFHHDHWLAMVAALHGSIIFVPEALVSYRLHHDNLIGPRISKPKRSGGLQGWVSQNRKLRDRFEIKFACYDSIKGECLGGRRRLTSFAWKALKAGDYQAACLYFRAILAGLF